METDFPEIKGEYLKASDFQDNPTKLNFLGWERVKNEDDPADSKKKNKLSWKQKLKFQLRYSYPQYAVDEAGDQILDENGEPFVNRYYDERYPNGYSIRYIFHEGTLESGSLPLFKAFCRLKPKEGECVEICRTGKDKDTKWTVKKSTQLPKNEAEEIGPDEDWEPEPDESDPF